MNAVATWALALIALTGRSSQSGPSAVPVLTPTEPLALSSRDSTFQASRSDSKLVSRAGRALRAPRHNSTQVTIKPQTLVSAADAELPVKVYPVVSRLGNSSATCYGTADIVVIADVSGSVGQEGLTSTKIFLRKLMARLQLGSGVGQQLLGLIEVAEKGKILSHLTSDVVALDEAISSLTLDDFGARIDIGFSLAGNVASFGRQNALTTVFIVTDGGAVFQNAAVETAGRLRQYAKMVALLVSSVRGGPTFSAVNEWLEAGHVAGPAGVFLWADSYDTLARCDTTVVLAALCSSLA